MYKKYNSLDNIKTYFLKDKNTGYYASYSKEYGYHFNNDIKNIINFINTNIYEKTTDLQLIDYHYLYTNIYINHFSLLPFYNKIKENITLKYPNYHITLNWLNNNYPGILSFDNNQNIFFIIVNNDGTLKYTIDISKASKFEII